MEDIMSFKLNLTSDYSVRPQARHLRLQQLRAHIPMTPARTGTWIMAAAGGLLLLQCAVCAFGVL